MAKVRVLEDKQTGNGRIVKTEREWTTEDGHKVIVRTHANIACQTTWAGRNSAFNETTYTCECGRKWRTMTVPSKKVLANHSNWMTEAQREERAQMLQASLGIFSTEISK